MAFRNCLVIHSIFPCSSEQSFLGRLPARAGSLLPERLRLSAAGGNDRQIAKQIAESGVHAGRPGRSVQHFAQGKVEFILMGQEKAV